MMNFLLLCPLLLVATLQIKWDVINVAASARGDLNPALSYWTGALTECDDQCASKNGTPCGTNQWQCCASPDNCTSSFGVQTCSQLVSGFKCTPDPNSPFKLVDTLSPSWFPQFASLYN
jgi:hypothetical protein